MIKTAIADLLLKTGATAVLATAGNILLRKGLLSRGGYHPTNIVEVFWKFVYLLAQPMFVLGLVLYVAGILVWMTVMSSSSLQVAYPVLVGLSFVAVTIGNSIVFEEPVRAMTVVGSLIIMAGITFVLYGN